MPGIELPPFPDDVPTHPLLVVDYELIKSGDNREIERLWKAATGLGFWYLKNHGADFEVEEMLEMGDETMRLPLDEKMQFEQGDSGQSFGYKAAGANATDEKGNIDSVEFINISRDDALAYPKVVHRTYPSTVNNRMEFTVKPPFWLYFVAFAVVLLGLVIYFWTALPEEQGKLDPRAPAYVKTRSACNAGDPESEGAVSPEEGVPTLESLAPDNKA